MSIGQSGSSRMGSDFGHGHQQRPVRWRRNTLLQSSIQSVLHLGTVALRLDVVVFWCFCASLPDCR